MNELGKLLVVIGLIVAAIGAMLWLGIGRTWFGRLPGDIHYSCDNFSFNFPIVTCLLISIVLTISSLVVPEMIRKQVLENAQGQVIIVP